MRIENLRLTNFMCYAEHEVKLSRQFNLIVGDNGKGKTTLLNAASVALGAAMLSFPEPANARSINREEVHRKFYTKGQTTTAEPQFPCVVECSGEFNGFYGSWARELKSEDSRTTRQNAKELRHVAKVLHGKVQENQDDLLPVISSYGTGRLWVQLSQTNVRTLKPDTRFQGYLDCLNPASNEKRLVEWFKTNELSALQKKTPIDVLEACRRAVCACVPGSSNVYFDVSLDQLVLEIDGDSVPFSYLSDGYRNMLAVAADIAVRCATLNPQLRAEAATSTPGVVLIDEIDLHLHPKWQRSVIGNLMQAFPLVQFIATTHSPFVIQSLPTQKGVQLINLDDEANRDFHDKSVEDIAEWIQGVDLPQRSRRYIDMMEKARVYLTMLKDDSSVSEEEKQRTRQELNQLIQPYGDSPAYHAFLKMQELATGNGNGTGATS